MPRPSLIDLKERVAYEPETGLLSWREDCSPRTFPSVRAWKIWMTKFGGKPVQKTQYGYVVVAMSVGGESFSVFGHVAAWALAHGEWPQTEVDHKNRARSDNRLKNLRLASHVENNWNKSVYANNACGHKGVHKHSQNGNWIAQIRLGGKTKHLGVFATPEAAATAYANASKAAHGDFHWTQKEAA